MDTLDERLAHDIRAVLSNDQVPRILDVCARLTGMRFCAIARVTEDSWITCASLDQLGFGFRPGDEMPVETMIGGGLRDKRSLVVFDDIDSDESYSKYRPQKTHGLRSFISVPMILKSGEFFGTLCAIDSEPRRINTPETIAMFELFADLIAGQIQTQDRLDQSTLDLLTERESARLREQFIAVVGHDLRNPIAAMGAGVRLLQRQTTEPTLAGFLADMARTVRRAGAIIEDLLDFAQGRLGGGIKAHLRDDVRVDAIIRDVAGEIASVEGEVFRIDCDVAVPVRCDPERFGRLVSNLLRNAVSHGTPGAPVLVRAVADAGTLTFSVTNSGKTIAPDIMPFLFQPFLRGITNGSEGLGLGLYIGDQIAKAHRGTLTARSREGTTTFEFKMPLV